MDAGIVSVRKHRAIKFRSKLFLELMILAPDFIVLLMIYPQETISAHSLEAVRIL
jgi:hypothetical protein